jgi:hypothetical protein
MAQIGLVLFVLKVTKPSIIWTVIGRIMVKIVGRIVWGNCNIHAELKILFINETKWYKIWPRLDGCVLKNLLNFTAKFSQRTNEIFATKTWLIWMPLKVLYGTCDLSSVKMSLVD